MLRRSDLEFTADLGIALPAILRPTIAFPHGEVSLLVDTFHHRVGSEIVISSDTSRVHCTGRQSMERRVHPKHTIVSRWV